MSNPKFILETKKAVAVALRELRQERDLKQEDLAQRMGVTRVYVSGLENARHDPSASMLRLLAKAFGMTPGALLDEIDKRVDHRHSRR